MRTTQLFRCLHLLGDKFIGCQFLIRNDFPIQRILREKANEKGSDKLYYPIIIPYW